MTGNSGTHRARKRFGQNFLNDTYVIQRIIDHIAISVTDHIVEIGPGLGALTRPLLQRCAQLDVIEIDSDLANKLKLIANHPTETTQAKLIVHEADAMKFDLSQLLPKPLRIVGNLPYNISTPLLFHLFKYLPDIKDCHLMLQTEVAQRLAAQPGSKTYGRLSVMAQYYCDVELLFNVDSHSFNPRPKVSSTILQLKPRPQNLLHAYDEQLLADIVRQAFSQRRKYLSNVLKAFVSAAELTELQLKPQLRVEHLTVKDFVKICNFVSHRGKK